MPLYNPSAERAAASATPAAVSTTGAVGTGTTDARDDHVHAHEAAHVAHDTIWDTAGDLVQASGADAASKLAISVPAANILNVLGVANGETTWSVKSLHDATNPAAIGTAAPGTSLLASHRDHVHATGAGTPSTQAIGDAAAVGTGPAAAMTDHKHAMPAFGTGPAAVGTQANGSSANIARIDHVHATGAGTPSTQAFGDAAATGSGPAAAMTDHKHAMPANPVLSTGLASDATVNGTTTMVKITGLDLTLAAGSYNFKYTIRYQTSVTTTGVKFAVNFSGTQTAIVTNHYFAQALSTAATTAANQTTNGANVGLASFMGTRANNVTVGPTASADATTDMLWVVEGMIVVTVSGDLQLFHGSETANNTQVMTGSGLVAFKVA